MVKKIKLDFPSITSEQHKQPKVKPDIDKYIINTKLQEQKKIDKLPRIKPRRKATEIKPSVEVQPETVHGGRLFVRNMNLREKDPVKRTLQQVRATEIQINLQEDIPQSPIQFIQEQK